MKTCGQCHYGKMTKDLNIRVCWGGPPLMLVLPGPKPGVVNISNARPSVKANDEACALWEPKSMQQIANEQDNAEAPAAPPKQDA